MDRRKFSKTLSLVAVVAAAPQIIFAKAGEPSLSKKFIALPEAVQTNLNDFAEELKHHLRDHSNQSQLIRNYLTPKHDPQFTESMNGYSCRFENIIGNIIEFRSVDDVTTTLIT